MLSKLIPLLAAPALTFAQQPTTVQDTLFHPISMAEAVTLAERNNPAAVIAANQIRSAENQVRSARAALYPNLTTSLSQSKSAGQRLGQSGQLVDYTSSWTYGLGVNSSITLFDGGRMFADIRTQRANVDAAEVGQTAIQFSLAQQVKTQYNAILAAKESEAAAQAQLALAEQQLAAAVAKVNAGTANVSDSLRNVVAVGNARLAILNAQQSVRTNSAGLTRLVGTPFLLTAITSDTGDVPMKGIDSATVMQLALNGPSVRQAVAQIQSLSAAERSARAAYLPTVTAGLAFSGNGNDPYGFGSNPFPYSRALNFGFSYPIFNRFQRENSIASAQIALDNAEVSLKDQRLFAQQNILTQIAALRNAEETIRVQQLNVRLNEEDLRINQQRYNLGVGLLIDVLTSESNLVTARQQLIAGRLNYRNARAQIEALIGQDLP